MTQHDKVGTRSSLRLGFFTAVPLADGGYVGGYLILNGVGRPIEFHCTTPVRPTRAQEILYGPTLKPYLLGEQMAPALIAKAKSGVEIVFVSEWEALTLSQVVEQPVVLVVSPETTEAVDCGLVASAASGGRCPSATGAPFVGAALLECGAIPACRSLQIGRNTLLIPESSRETLTQVQEFLSPWAEAFDLLEPFGRIRAALEEALRRG
ncbi:hypothetical protein [Thermogutta sp.]|uniref:hypothetical protein n=1 Tax=Thermogutta sp. TaxID=1962930 RepID=UPI00321FA8E4